MRIESVPYRQWRDCYRCTAGQAELIAIAGLGPRILSLRWRQGPNLLYEDPTGVRVGEWRLYGGHRFTVAPEGKETYLPDNQPCLASRLDHQLELASTPGGIGLCRSLVVSEAKDGDGFDLAHRLTNPGPDSWRGAPWAITCIPHGPLVAAGNGRLRFWPGTNPSAWRIGADGALTVPRDRRGKVGWHSPKAWLATVQPGVTFVIHDPSPPDPEQAVDGGCNLEIFACPEYIELETLGPSTCLRPGQSIIHEQRWRLLDPGLIPSDGAAIAARAGCASASTA